MIELSDRELQTKAKYDQLAREREMDTKRLFNYLESGKKYTTTERIEMVARFRENLKKANPR